ncbi:MAG: coenzyme F420-0:L-glutamate ligase [Candidatus Thorarchaeota archaeon]
MTRGVIEVIGIEGLPLVKYGDSLIELIQMGLDSSGIALQNQDILVIAHTIVSKVEGRLVEGKLVTISERAQEIADSNGFDPIQVELALQESKEILREDGVLITETRSGLICNFGGVDKSNAPDGFYILLPEDADVSAKQIREELEKRTGCRLAVVISDTQGRPWRRGSVNVAIGCSRINAFKYNRGKRDLRGRTLERSTVCQVDEVAAVAEPIMGQAAEGIPIVIVRGYEFEEGDEGASSINRSKEEDLFR